MGFFKWVAGKATGAIGSAVTRVGKIFHSDKVENAGRAIKAFGDNLAGDIGKTGSYDSTSGDVRQTQKVHYHIHSLMQQSSFSVFSNEAK